LSTPRHSPRPRGACPGIEFRTKGMVKLAFCPETPGAMASISRVLSVRRASTRRGDEGEKRRRPRSRFFVLSSLSRETEGAGIKGRMKRKRPLLQHIREIGMRKAALNTSACVELAKIMCKTHARGSSPSKRLRKNPGRDKGEKSDCGARLRIGW